MAKTARKPPELSPLRSAPRSEATSRRLSLPVLVGTIAGLAILLPGLYFWRQREVLRSAATLIEQAEADAKEGELLKSAQSLQMYLQLRPDDVHAQIQYAEAVGRLATGRKQLDQAIAQYYKAVGVAAGEERRSLQLKLAELLLQTEQFLAAEQQVRPLYDANPQDAAAVRLYALALYGRAQATGFKPAKLSKKQQVTQNDADEKPTPEKLKSEKPTPEIDELLSQACRLNKTDVQLAVTLATAYRGDPKLLSEKAAALAVAKRNELADQCLDRLVEANPKQASARLARYQYRLAHGIPEATADLEQAIAAAPDDPLVTLAAAQNALQQAVGGKKLAERETLLKQAKEYCEKTLSADPQSEQAYLVMGEVQSQQGLGPEAEKTWLLGLEKTNKQSVPLNARLAQWYLSQQQPDRAAACVEALQSLATNLRQHGYAEAQLDFAAGADVLQAQVHLAKGEMPAAVKLLQKVGAGQKSGPFSYQALMLLGGAYSSQGEYLQAAGAFEAAAANRREAVEPRLAAAAAWTALDRPERAESQVQKAVALDPSAVNNTLLAASRLRAQLKLPQQERDWTSFEQALADAKRAQAASGTARDLWKLSVLEADYLLSQNGDRADGTASRQQALKVLRSAESGASAEGLENLARVYTRLAATKDTDRVLELLSQQYATLPNTYLTASALLAARKEFDAALARLDDGLKAIPQDQGVPLQLAKVQILMRQGRQEQAWEALGELHRQLPKNQAVLEQYLEYALDHGKFQEAESLQKALEELAGASAVSTKFFDSRRRLLQSTGASDPQLADVQKTVEEICRQRPEWPAGQLLSAELQERLGNPSEAVVAYQKAIQLGERRLVVYERLINLLYQLQRFKEATQYLSDLRDSAAGSAELSGVGINLAMRQGQLDEALELARRGVAQRPQDPLAQIWLAQLLDAADQPAEAEAALQQAVANSPADPRARGALVNHLVRTKQPELARATLEEYAKQEGVAASVREQLLSAGLEALGDRTQAMEHLRAAVKLEPQNVDLQVRLGVLLSGSDPTAAEQALRQAFKLNPQSTSARRALAGLLSDLGGEKNWQEAMSLLAVGDDANGSSPSATGNTSPAAATAADQKAANDQRLQVVLLLRRGGSENLAKARQIVEKLLAQPQTAGPDERRMLAQIQEAQGQATEARDSYLSLVKGAAARPEDLAAYVDFLLRQNVTADAAAAAEIEKWLDKLEQQQPDPLATVGFRVRLLMARQQTDQLATLLEPLAKRLLSGGDEQAKPSEAQKIKVSSSLGDLYYTAGQFAAAERWYRRAYKLDPKWYGRLARSIAEQGRATEAIELCLSAAQQDSSTEPAEALAFVLMRAKASASDAAKAETLLDQSVAAHADNPKLLATVAALRVTQQRLDDAAKLYQQLLEQQPQNVSALNDLATVLAENPQRLAEALEYANRAIELAGPQANLLDTKGTILLAQGKLAEAVALLSQAASAPRPDPRYHFHLAVALYRSGDLDKAREALAVAQARELTRQVLTAGDLKQLAELEANLR